MPSPIQIKRPDVAADIRALADLAGLSITDAVGIAVREKLGKERARASAALAGRHKEIQKGLAKLRRLPIVGPAIKDGDLYDSEGLPK